MIKFSKICLYQNWIFENLENPRIFFYENPYVFNLEEQMITNEIKDGREAP